MFSKFEVIGISASVIFMALALYLIRIETDLLAVIPETQTAQVASRLVVVGEGENRNNERATALVAAAPNGKLMNMVIEDVKQGSGDSVEVGNTVTVHYVGTLQDGTEFDNSNKRGTPFTFTVGDGQVIKGWDEGLVGMKQGGQRILVIPPDMAYGPNGIGPIPGNATLVFAIELLSIE